MLGWFRKKKDANALPEWRIAAQFAARARWITHFCDFAGDPSEEWTPTTGFELPDRPEFLVLEFPANAERQYWTYLTAGLSLVAQPGDAELPHLEVVAYSPERDPRIGEFLFMLSHDIATHGPDEPSFKAFDLWGAQRHGLRDFMLVPAKEPPELLDFPNRDKRKEDERYLLAATGELDGTMKLDLLQLVPLSTEEWEQASNNRSAELLDAIHWAEQPKTYGWSAIEPH